MMKKILVLGGTRYFGKRLVEKCLAEGHEVTIGTRGITPDPFGDRVNRKFFDRTDSGEFRRAFQGTNWDLIYDQYCYSSQEALDAVSVFEGRVGRYIHTSTQSVYIKNGEVSETDFDPWNWETTPATRNETSYGEGKRRAEAVFFQKAKFPVAAVRFSLVMGEDDWSGRMEFHLKRIREGRPMVIPNLDAKVSLLHSSDAGNLLYDLGLSSFTGPLNACAEESWELKRIIDLMEKNLQKKALIVKGGKADDHTPFTGRESRFMNSSLAAGEGLRLRPVCDWLPDVVRRLQEPA